MLLSESQGKHKTVKHWRKQCFSYMEKRLSKISFSRALWCPMASNLSLQLMQSNLRHTSLSYCSKKTLSPPIIHRYNSWTLPYNAHVLTNYKRISSVQLLNCVSLFVTPWTTAFQASLSITNSRSLLKLMSTESVMPSNHIILCHPLLFPPSIFPSIRVFSNESVLCIRWSKYWSFSFSTSSSNEYSGLISFRMDWLDLLAVQGTRRSLLQHHISKASTLQCSAFFTVQLSHPYMTTRKILL